MFYGAPDSARHRGSLRCPTGAPAQRRPGRKATPGRQAAVAAVSTAGKQRLPLSQPRKKHSTFYGAFLQVLDREHRGCVLAGSDIEIHRVQWANLDGAAQIRGRQTRKLKKTALTFYGAPAQRGCRGSSRRPTGAPAQSRAPPPRRRHTRAPPPRARPAHGECGAATAKLVN